MIDAIALSIIVALVRKGSIRRLGELDLRYTWIIFVSGFVMALMFTKHLRWMAFVGDIAPIMHLVVYLTAIVVIVLNRHLPGMLLIGLGALLNFAAISANGGKMPISYDAAKYARMEHVLTNDLARHCVIDCNTKLYVLTDVIPLRRPPFPLPGVMSVGDIILAIGLFILIQHGMCSPKKTAVELVARADPAG